MMDQCSGRWSAVKGSREISDLFIQRVVKYFNLFSFKVSTSNNNAVNDYSMKKLNDKEKIEVVEKYLAGASSCQLSKEYGITDTSILGLLKRRGIVRRTKSDYK